MRAAGDLLQCCPDHPQAGVQANYDIIVPEPQDLHATARPPRIAAAVGGFVLWLGMLTTIELDRQPGRSTVGVADPAAERVLPAELGSHGAARELLPGSSLGVRRLTS